MKPNVRYIILCDFDGTITLQDTCVPILEQFAVGDWEKYDNLLSKGLINLHECVSQFVLGHGPVVDQSYLEKILVYLENIKQYIKSFKNNGRSFEQMHLNSGFPLFFEENEPKSMEQVYLYWYETL